MLPQIQPICSDFANLNLFTTIFRGFSQLFLRICFWIEPPYEGFEDYLWGRVCFSKDIGALPETLLKVNRFRFFFGMLFWQHLWERTDRLEMLRINMFVRSLILRTSEAITFVLLGGILFSQRSSFTDVFLCYYTYSQWRKIFFFSLDFIIFQIKLIP